jgi:hypothetical protein
MRSCNGPLVMLTLLSVNSPASVTAIASQYQSDGPAGND